jgi:DNA-binding MarR family transcriptional regulator
MNEEQAVKPLRDDATALASSSGQAALKAASHEQRLDSAVATLIEEWAGVIPSLDKDVRAIAARIARIDDRLRERTAAVLKQAGLSDNEFRLLAALKRLGPPYRAAPTDIAGRYVPVTSGGLTGLANRLEQRGLICRVSHPRDQRSVLIELTDAGRELARQTMSEFSKTEEMLMAGLSEVDRARGNAFLKKLLNSIEAALR